MEPIALPPTPRILIIVLRRLGDVLLATPLFRSVRRAYPQATIDVLVFNDTRGILAGNPDIDTIIGMPSRPNFAETRALLGRLWRSYDLSVSVHSGDRPVFYALAAGRKAIAPVETRASGRLKAALLTRHLEPAGELHRVDDNLRLAACLGIPAVPEIICPVASDGAPPPQVPYAVIHAAPMFRYKQWTAEGWRALARALREKGLRVLITGGPAPQERAYLDTIWQDVIPAADRFDGKLSWGELAAWLAAAKVFIGPDTAVTHLAAAAGAPTVALFGPTEPRLWGPWPVGGLDRPWEARAALQQRGNVWIVQHTLICSPCHQEGCDRHIGSYSLCLDGMLPIEVTDAVGHALVGTR